MHQSTRYCASVNALISIGQQLESHVLQEFETSLAGLVERGVVAESEIVASLKQVLPEQFQTLIPQEIRNAAPQSPAVTQQQAQEAFYEEPPLSAEQLSISQSGVQLFSRAAC